jgi:hypothetical protein
LKVLAVLLPLDSCPFSVQPNSFSLYPPRVRGPALLSICLVVVGWLPVSWTGVAALAAFFVSPISDIRTKVTMPRTNVSRTQSRFGRGFFPVSLRAQTREFPLLSELFQTHRTEYERGWNSFDQKPHHLLESERILSMIVMFKF